MLSSQALPFYTSAVAHIINITEQSYSSCCRQHAGREVAIEGREGGGERGGREVRRGEGGGQKVGEVERGECRCRPACTDAARRGRRKFICENQFSPPRLTILRVLLAATAVSHLLKPARSKAISCTLHRFHF